ncbi:hypothetical protein WA026_015407 [Henosepilachna vigintioctopunctata]|uniref:Tetratricopeptide repeat protein 39C n=1 Tax=Henosepilachna vigintioctopunctata TaxID=420089 RepID=A0AAW1UMQ0_9CUCU
MASISSDFHGQQDWVLAKQGLNLFINNKGEESEALFLKHSESLIMYSGYSYVVFMDALMSFEEDKLTKAISTLKEVEKRCDSRSWFKYFKKKVFGSADEGPSVTDTLETQIILADSQVCLAILVFLQQDISGYLKAGWVLRKAWKVYQSTYTDILNLYNSQIGPLNLPDPTFISPSSDNAVNIEKEILANREDVLDLKSVTGYILSNPFPHSRSTELYENTNISLSPFAHSPENLQYNNSSKNAYNTKSPNSQYMRKSLSVNSSLSKSNSWSYKLGSIGNSISFNYFTSTFGIFSSEKIKNLKPQLSKKAIIRLMNAVAFGYGLFQLGVSLLPPTLFKLTSFLGLKGNRMHGLACLMYARLGIDMRAPLATLALLWYHCIIRPFFGFDGTNVGAGVQMSNQLIRRVCRLNCDIPSALIAFQESVNNSTQREVKILSLHEVGWCHLIQLEFKNAELTFALLSTWSRWSRPFYCYITCICKGSRGEFVDYSELEELIVNIRMSTKGNNLDEFLIRRVICFPGRDEFSLFPTTFWKLFVYEMLYLWNSLASCTKENLLAIIKVCNLASTAKEPMKGISKLIQGSCHVILGDINAAVASFRKCIEERMDTDNTKDAHVLAFAQYELASLLITTPETKEEGRGLLQQTVLIKDYDFEDRLAVRVNSILKHG